MQCTKNKSSLFGGISPSQPPYLGSRIQSTPSGWLENESRYSFPLEPEIQ